MAGKVTEVPSFNFSAFYYPQILEALILFKRQNVPELTDESDFEPTIQFLRAFALVGHLNNVLIDLIANESTLPTAKLAESVRNMLRLIDFELSPAAPAGVDLLYTLNRVLTTQTEVVPAGAQASTKRGDGDVSVIYFEALGGLTCEPTNRFGAVFVEDSVGAFTDITAAINAGSGTSFTPEVGSKVYFGHETAMWSQLDLEVPSPSDVTIGVWEFYDGDVEDTKPDSVTNIGGGQLRFELNGLLGEQNRSGAEVTITLLSTGTSETVSSTWNGSENRATTTLLGQSSPSTDLDDYTVGVEWQEMDDVVDGTALLTQDGTVDYTLPQNEKHNWTTAEVNGFEGFFLRFRVVEVGSATAVTLDLGQLDQGDQFVLAPATQGRSVRDEVLGSSTGESNQRFSAAQPQHILDSNFLAVDGVDWTEVDNFLNSRNQDEHYTVELGEDNRATYVFGDGVRGKIPPIGQGNITVDYRHNAENDGNVGSDTVVVDKTGLTFIQEVTNPRGAAGWSEAQSASQEGLELAKIEGPASLRIQEVALGPDDLVTLAKSYRGADGSKPFSRAIAIEEGFGPKTMEVVLVAKGGNLATAQQLSDFERYLNGDKTATPPLMKRIIANQKAYPRNFTPRAINVTATVEAPPEVLAAAVVNQLSEVIQPEALEDDGVSFIWEFGGEVPSSRISHEIFKTDSRITKVQLTLPNDTQLGPRELPVPGTFLITVVQSL